MLGNLVLKTIFEMREEEYKKTQNLIRAIKKGDSDLVHLLVNQGAGVNSYNAQGLTPLCIAAIKGNSEIILQLIHLGADINKQSLTGFSPLSFATWANKKQAAEYLRLAGALETPSLEEIIMNGISRDSSTKIND
jgi:ankyrin repeat protein